ncbi:GNAT family N-acetyltransferase [Phaeobacter sp. NW0010-22]|uniref:GNAT family N-acetyltransferase n=1 Tax=Phaeobacter sp. NW0010-22 TaxID=3135907 RepID=UPI00310B3175
MPDYIVRPMTPMEVQTAIQWAADEGWNPGLADADSFLSVDPQGFWGGFLDGEMIASISVVNYDEVFAFLGFYIVRPEFRGEGLGLELWLTAIAHAGDRLVGLDGVVQEQENYRKSGFTLAYRNIRQHGSVAAVLAQLPTPRPEIAALSEISPQQLQYDRSVFPAPRDAFLQAWQTAPGHHARAVWDQGELRGYTVLRPCRDGYKIGPLFADDKEIARDLLAAVLDQVPANQRSQTVYLDTPDCNDSAMALAGELEMEPVFETARMYTGPAPDIDMTRIFGVTSFELG